MALPQHSIDTRVALLEQSSAETKETLTTMDSKLDTIIITLAEARGATKVGKIVAHLLTAAVGAVGGAGGGLAVAQKVAAAATQASVHVK